MKQYKTIAGPVALVIGSDQNENEAVKQYAAIIEREVVGGWELDSIQQITVHKEAPKAGCLGQLFILCGLIKAPSSESTSVNMLIFVKDN